MSRKHKLSLSLGLALSLIMAGCAQIPSPKPTGPIEVPAHKDQPQNPPSATDGGAKSGLPLSALEGWQEADAFIAYEALKGSCAYRPEPGLKKICQELVSQRFDEPLDIKRFFEDRFMAEAIGGEGLLTAYYVPEYQAMSQASDEFSQIIRTKPSDLIYVDGALMTPPQPGPKVAARREGGLYLPYYNRAEIEAMPYVPSPGQAVYYMRPEDYFFMQLQGSAYLSLEDGTEVIAAYAADNGQPFTGIAKPMIEKGIFSKDQASGEAIHQWLADHRGPEAQAMMNQNPRYAFFVIDKTKHEPLGAANVPLSPGAAIAVDPSFHKYGELIWIDGRAGNIKGAVASYQRVVAALDTGGAIKGNIRADLYMGRGPKAGVEAGRVRHRLKFWRLVPKP